MSKLRHCIATDRGSQLARDRGEIIAPFPSPLDADGKVIRRLSGGVLGQIGTELIPNPVQAPRGWPTYLALHQEAGHQQGADGAE